MNKWDKFFLDVAGHMSTLSKDPSSKFGAVIAQGKFQVSQGYNGFPAGVTDHPDLLNDRDSKLAIVIHAEENAILNCEKRDRIGATIYVGGPPCARCAAKIAQVGITRVVCYTGTQAFRDRWARDIELANHIYNEVGIEFVEYPQPDIRLEMLEAYFG